MEFSDHIIQEFPAASSGCEQGTLVTTGAQAKVEHFIQNRNRKPVVAFEGLSAKQMPLLAFSHLGFGLQSKSDSDREARLVFRDLQLVVFGEIQFKTLSDVGQTDARIVVVL